jgi:hypothetical protein
MSITKAKAMMDIPELDADALAALRLAKIGPVPRHGKIPYATATLLLRYRLIEESHVTYHGAVASTLRRVYRITETGRQELRNYS